jgi:hypothetical protein
MKVPKPICGRALLYLYLLTSLAAVAALDPAKRDKLRNPAPSSQVERSIDNEQTIANATLLYGK